MRVDGPGRRLTGAFINTHPAQCSIFESGEMVVGCLSNSSVYDLHHTSLAEIDLEVLSQQGRLVARADVPARSFPGQFDFWIFNWHFVTMAGHLQPAAIAALKGLKFTVVLELGEHDPLVHVPKGVFDGYLALDPLVEEAEGVYPFPRPLQGIPRVGTVAHRDTPVIGSFGFGTPGKGFELLVEAVGREFDKARIRINVPPGDYISADPTVGPRYAKHIAEMCRRIAKPGIEVEFTNDFMTPEALIEWCHANDLNCFMYTRDQPGLSATTDQAILSGQPLLTLTNATFRHIHPYIAPYPETSLRKAMITSAPAVAAMRRDWSKEAFRAKFEYMLGRSGLSLESHGQAEALPVVAQPDARRPTVLVLHAWDGADGDVLSYGTRFTNAISRPATRNVIRITCDSVGTALAACLDHQPDVVVALDHSAEWFGQLSAGCQPWRTFRLLHGPAIEGPNHAGSRPPIVPFFTNPISVAHPDVAWLIGFDDEFAPIHRWIKRIACQTDVSRIYVEAAPWNHAAAVECVARLGPVHRADGAALRIEVHSLPDEGGVFVNAFAADAFVVLRAGGDSTARTEAICSLALCTERAVMVDAAAPLPSFGDALTIGDDASLRDRIDAGLSGQIASVCDFGEWRVTARWMPLLNATVDHGSDRQASPIVAAIALSGLDSVDDATFVRGINVALLGREPDDSALAAQVDAICAGQTRSELAERVVGRVDALGTRAPRGAADERPLQPFDVLIRHWLDGLFRLDHTAFVAAAYRWALGRDPIQDELARRLQSLNSGAKRLQVLDDLSHSEEALRHLREVRSGQRPEAPPWEAAGSVGTAWMRCLRRLDDDAFLQAGATLILGRAARADETGGALPRADPAERWAFVESLLASPAAKTFGASTQSSSMAVRLSAMLDWVGRQEAAIAAIPDVAAVDDLPAMVPGPVAAPLARAPLKSMSWRVGPVTWLLVSSGAQALVDRWMAAGGDGRSTMVPIRWNAETRELQVDGEPGSSLAVSSHLCRAGEWLVLPGGLDEQAAAGGLPEMDIVMAARSLGLNVACIFHGAEPLDSIVGAPDAAACERYIQALLLADLVLPVSRRADDDLRDLLTQDQGTDESPPIVKLAFPSGALGGSDEAWSVYWRKLRSLFERVAQSREAIGAVCLLDVRDQGSLTECSPFHVPRLDAPGVLVHQLTRKANEVRYRDERVDSSIGPRPRWLIVEGPVTASDAPALARFAAKEGLQVAALGPASGPDGDFTPCLAFDRVFARSAADFEILRSQLLATRQRLPVAEERFAWIEDSFVGASEVRPPARPVRTDGTLRLCVAAESASDPGIETVLDGALAAARRARRDIAVTIAHSGAAGKHSAEGHDAMRTVHLAAEGGLDEALDTDVVLVLGSLGFSRRMTEAASWHGVPSVVGVDGVMADMRGVMAVDVHQREDVADGLVRLLDDTWRGTLHSEAAHRAPRTDRDRADDLFRALARDDPFRHLGAVQGSGRGNIYARLPAVQRRPLLSVCISTYNRAGWLALNLKNLMAQIGAAEAADVEVVVVDNAATDATPQAVQPFLGRPEFRYYRNRRNVGMLGNLAVTAQRARGKYVWIIGDDDLTQADAVGTVIAALHAHPGLAMVYLNYGYTSVDDPATVTDIPLHLQTFNVLEPAGPDSLSTVAKMAANNENFYTAIYACVFQRVHAIRAFCQDTSGRPFSTMLTCIPTSYYALRHMGSLPAYWIGKPLLVVNSNVSWAQYGPLFDLEQLPRAWDLAERAGAPPEAVDKRRSNRLWLVEMMWRDIFEKDTAGNGPWFSASRVLTRLKHLADIDSRIAMLRAIYQEAHGRRHPCATMHPDILFAAWPVAAARP